MTCSIPPSRNSGTLAAVATAVLVAAALLLVGLFATSAPAEVRYTVTDLGTFGGPYLRNTATAISNNGTIAGVSDDGVVYRAAGWLYRNGAMHDIGNLGQNTLMVDDVNDSGVVVGGSWTTTTYSNRAFIYSDGTLSPLYQAPGKLCYEAQAINSSGQVTGYGYYGQAYIYQGGQFQIIQPDWVRWSIGYAINERGDVAGDYDTNTEGYNHAFARIDGQWHYLGSLGLSSTAYGINDLGMVVGMSYDADGRERAFFWQEGTMQDLGTLGGDRAEALAINNSGTVIGWAHDSTGNRRPFLWQDGVMVNLNTLVDGPAVAEVTDINDRGQIVGRATNNHAILLTPVPEPAALGLLGLGLAGLLRRRKRGWRSAA